jgi:hypothetical protein
MLVAALAAAQTLDITADIKPYGAPPYSPSIPGATFNLYEWVVINGTVTPKADFVGNITVTVYDTLLKMEVARCTATNIALSTGKTYKLYDQLRSRDCRLKLNPSYTHAGLVRVRETDELALNFTDVPLRGDKRYVIYVTFKSGAGSRTFNATFSVSDTINLTVKAFGERIITAGTPYPHNTNYHFRLVVDVAHPDGRPYSNTSITVYVDNNRKITRYWANKTDPPNYQPSIDNSIWEFTISDSEFTSSRLYNIMVNVSNIRVNVRGNNIVGYAVTGVNKGQLNFVLNVTDKLTVEFINVTAVWPDRDSTPLSRRGKPTGVSYTDLVSFNESKWTLGDSFRLYVQVFLANGTAAPVSQTDYQIDQKPDIEAKLTVDGNYAIVTVDATMQPSDWNSEYRSAHSGVMVNVTLRLKDGRGNTGELPLKFIVTNTTMTFNETIFFGASKAAITKGSKVNLGDVIVLNLTVKTYGGRELNFTQGFDIRVYNVTNTGSIDFTPRFDITRHDNFIYLTVKPSRGAWGITKDNWRSFMPAIYLAVSVTERGKQGYMNLTLRWPKSDESFNIYVTAKLPRVEHSLNVSTVDYGQVVRLTFNFTTYGGNKPKAKNLTLYVHRIDTRTLPFGRKNMTTDIVGTSHLEDGNYTFVFEVTGSKIWIPGVWYINATVGDVFGNAGDLNDTRLFTIEPKIKHSLPKSLRVTAGKTVQISSSLKWGNDTDITSDAKLNITIVYPTSDGRSNATITLRNQAEISISIPAPNVPDSYRIVVNFTYMTFGVKVYDRWVINLTVYVSVDETISEMRSNPNLVAVAVGRSVPRGPVKGALVEDNLAAAALAAVVGTNNVFFDDELLNPNTLDYKTVAGPYRYIIAVGGPIVNLFSYKYNKTLSSIVQTYVKGVEVGFEIKVPSDIIRVYLNETDRKYRIVYANGTVKVVGDYGKIDFAIVATLYDASVGKYISSVGKYIFVSFGIDWRGTVAAGRWIAANINNLDKLAGSQLVLLQWTDVNNDGSIQADEVQPILSA